MLSNAPSLLDSFSALSDATRCRMLWLLDRHELTVSELCTILQLPQSTVSRHLRLLSDADWVVSRRDGTSRYYALSLDGVSGPRAKIWELTRSQMSGRAIEQDARRLTRVLAERREASQQFFATSAGHWDRLREELFGRDVVPSALLGLLPSEWTVGDLGCGTGALLPVFASHVARVIGVDASTEMLGAARARVSDLPNVELREGTLEALPVADASLDAAVFALVLHHVPSPAEALSEAARVLKSGGRLLIIDMTSHDREEYRQRMGHIWLGFSEDQMSKFLSQAGFSGVRISSLPPAAEAKGPALFAATAAKPTNNYQRATNNELSNSR
jgi:ubiquinone/menaquinone biosynthesis C-methylase UbiE/DNA-binding transcriptional ArsR family regulator